VWRQPALHNIERCFLQMRSRYSYNVATLLTVVLCSVATTSSVADSAMRYSYNQRSAMQCYSQQHKVQRDIFCRCITDNAVICLYQIYVLCVSSFQISIFKYTYPKSHYFHPTTLYIHPTYPLYSCHGPTISNPQSHYTHPTVPILTHPSPALPMLHSRY
jgi:hypothetical protein